jgi:regulator-associated protein of mTOR
LSSVYFDERDSDLSYCFSQLAKERATLDRNLFISSEVRSALRFYDDRRRFDEEIAIFQTDFKRTSKVLLHSYDPLMIATDYEQRIGVWNYEDGYKVNMFSNHTSKFLESKNKVTSLKLINESSDSMLLCGSDDGVFRLWKDFQSQGGQKLVSAWVASVKVTKPGLIIDWQPSKGSIVRIFSIEF